MNVTSYIFDHISIDVTKKSLQWTGIKICVIDRYDSFSLISRWWSLIVIKNYSILACLCYHLLIASLIKVVRPSNFLHQVLLIFEIRPVDYLLPGLVTNARNATTLPCEKPGIIWSFNNTPYLSVFSPNAGKYKPEKLRVRTLFTQC